MVRDESLRLTQQGGKSPIEDDLTIHGSENTLEVVPPSACLGPLPPGTLLSRGPLYSQPASSKKRQAPTSTGGPARGLPQSGCRDRGDARDRSVEAEPL